MHEIHMAEVTDEFARCWSAAGNHILNHAKGALKSWLRAHLKPPFLEHLSFRLGNQLFYIQLVDIDDRLRTPGNREGLLSIADGCAGHACLMPMRLNGVAWEAANPGWGLIDARSGSQIDPPALVTDEEIVMTDWELLDMAVQVVRDSVISEGYELMSSNGDPGIDPSLWFVGESGGPEWVIVRVARHPSRQASKPENILSLKAQFEKSRYSGHFASVVIASADDPFDPDAETNGNFMPLYRGYAMHIRYEGLRPI